MFCTGLLIKHVSKSHWVIEITAQCLKIRIVSGKCNIKGLETNAAHVHAMRKYPGERLPGVLNFDMEHAFNPALQSRHRPSGRLICECCWHLRWTYSNLWSFCLELWGWLVSQGWEWGDLKESAWKLLGVPVEGGLPAADCILSPRETLQMKSSPRRKWPSNVSEW